MTALDLEGLRTWVGRTRTTSFTLDPWPAAALTAALDRDDPPDSGDPLPPFWHQLYGLTVVRAGETGPDGHARRGGFLPPVPLPRRMWAGGRLALHAPLRLGERVERVSEIRSITPKAGRRGSLVFVLVEHRLANANGLAVVEEHDIVYRNPPQPGEQAQSTHASIPGTWQRTWVPDEVMLFRYSALTYNGHRIHYDQPYVTKVEGYPGLIVHGPLLATFMLDLVRRERPNAEVRRFAFRATAPSFAGEKLTVHGDPAADELSVALRVTGPGGRLVMTGEAELETARR